MRCSETHRSTSREEKAAVVEVEANQVAAVVARNQAAERGQVVAVARNQAERDQAVAVARNQAERDQAVVVARNQVERDQAVVVESMFHLSQYREVTPVTVVIHQQQTEHPHSLDRVPSVLQPVLLDMLSVRSVTHSITQVSLGTIDQVRAHPTLANRDPSAGFSDHQVAIESEPKTISSVETLVDLTISSTTRLEAFPD